MNKKIKKCIKKIKSYLEIEKSLNDLENKNYIVERDLFATYKSLEYKIWEFNTCTNKILYELDLKSKTLDKKFHPKVSIIMPVYNGSDFIAEAIESALNQTYDNIEIIVINDGSTDNGKTRNVVEKYKDKIKYYEKKNGGVSSALNYGISKMTGEYFAWLSHDDLIENIHIEKLVEYISYKENKNTIPFSCFKIVDEFGMIKLNETIIAQLHCSDYKISVLKNEYTLLQGEINGGSVLIPKKAFEKYGLFNEEQRITQERDMWSRLIGEYKFVNVPYDTSIIRSHSKQVTNTNPRIKIETDEKNLQIIKEMPEIVKGRLEGNETSFYVVMKKFFENNNNNYMKEQMEKLIERTRRK